MRVNRHQTLRKRDQLPVVFTDTGESASVIADEGPPVSRVSTVNQPGLLRVFELLIKAAALAQPVNEEVAHFTMLAAFVTGERLGIPDEIVNRMRDGALTEAMRSELSKSGRLAKDRAKGR